MCAPSPFVHFHVGGWTIYKSASRENEACRRYLRGMKTSFTVRSSPSLLSGVPTVTFPLTSRITASRKLSNWESSHVIENGMGGSIGHNNVTLIAACAWCASAYDTGSCIHALRRNIWLLPNGSLTYWFPVPFTSRYKIKQRLGKALIRDVWHEKNNRCDDTGHDSCTCSNCHCWHVRTIWSEENCTAMETYVWNFARFLIPFGGWGGYNACMERVEMNRFITGIVQRYREGKHGFLERRILRAFKYYCF